MHFTSEDLLNFLQETSDLDTSSIDERTLLFSTGLIDSFNMVDLVAYLEERCGFRVRPMDVSLDNLDSIERILNFAKARSQSLDRAR